jgi:phage-related protein
VTSSDCAAFTFGLYGKATSFSHHVPDAGLRVDDYAAPGRIFICATERRPSRRNSAEAPPFEFPEIARQRTGFQVRKVQNGEDPDDWKPMPTIGKGVREIRISDSAGIYRTVYLANLPDAVHVYHVFQKKTQKTDKRDIDIAKMRYQEHMRSLK